MIKYLVDMLQPSFLHLSLPSTDLIRYLNRIDVLRLWCANLGLAVRSWKHFSALPEVYNWIRILIAFWTCDTEVFQSDPTGNLSPTIFDVYFFIRVQ